MFAKLLLKVTNIIKREKTITTIVSAPAKLDVVEHKSTQLQPTIVTPPIVSPSIVSIVTPSIVSPSIVTPSIVTPHTIGPISDEPNQSIVIFPTVRDQTSIKSQCKTCTGCGFVKTVTIICDMCNGIKCMYCNSLGLSQLPWSECNICYGSGEIIHS